VNQQRKTQGRSRRRRSQRARTADLWRPVPQLPDPEAISPINDPTALLRSLGDPPLQGQSTVGGHYLAAVIERAAQSATALATMAELVHRPGEDPDPSDQ
jgi:hypothetical protein